MNNFEKHLVINKIINTSIICIAIFALPLNIITYFALNESEYVFPRLIPPALGFIVIISAFCRNKIIFTVKAWGLIIFLFIAGCFNLILGLIDTASLWFVLSIIHTLFIAKRNEALSIFFISFLTILLVGILMMVKKSFIPLNYHFENCQFACVAVRIIHFLLIGFLIYYILHIFISTIKRNIADLQEKNIQLNYLNIALQNEMKEKKIIQQQLLDTVILTEEKERQRIATDLHDGLGPVLSAINLYFDAFIDAPENQKTEIGIKLKKIIGSAINDVSRISHNISPYILENFGFINALESFIHPLKESEKIKINFTAKSIGRFELRNELTIYRAITELISNTIKHANASIININIFTDDNLLKIFYSDDGIGFEKSVILSKGMGINNIKNRIAAIKGTISIETASQKGMKACIEIPYKMLTDK